MQISKTPLCNIGPQAGCDAIGRRGIQTVKQLFTYLHAGFHADVDYRASKLFVQVCEKNFTPKIRLSGECGEG